MGWRVSVLVFLSLALFVVKAVILDDDNAIPSLKSESKGSISPRDVSRSVVAIKLSQVVNDGYKDDIDVIIRKYGFDPDDGIYLESGTDAVYLARVGDKYCSASFRATTINQVGDWLTNVDLEPVAFGATNPQQGNITASGDGSESLQGCDLHRGYHDAYTNFEYRDVVENFLGACRSECAECETILTGHSQGGGIAAIAALYLKLGDLNETETPVSNTNDYDSPYVILFAAMQSLGAGCDQLIPKNERSRWFRYILAREQEERGGKLVYDPIPLLYAQLLDSPEEEDQSSSDEGFWGNFGEFLEIPTEGTYARNGGLAYIGHEILLSTGDPSAILLSEFDGHRFVDLSNIDPIGLAHQDYLYAEVLEAQDKIYNRNNNIEDCREGENSAVECPKTLLPSNGFKLGSLCNAGESEYSSTCVEGTVCMEEEKEWFWEATRHSCQSLPSDGLAVGSNCNANEIESSSNCTQGAICKEEEKQWFWEATRYTCQSLRHRETSP